MDYKKSGVNIEAGEDAVSRIKPLVRATFNQNVLTDIGGFGGLYALDLAKWKHPVLVSSMDGVGTKILVAQMAGVYDTVGQDLVNHCVNDIFVQGAIPQYFLDYIGVGRLSPDVVVEIISGLSKACSENRMSLIGGEMAEMPGIYAEKDFDLAGTIVGLVEKENLINGSTIKEGDVILGYPSNGLHTNGYSLARQIVFHQMNLAVDSYIPELQDTVGAALLKVHPSYFPILANHANPQIIHGMAHITGGGLPGNVKRIIPDGLQATIDTKTWERPTIFRYLMNTGQIDENEMYRAFNMGIGFIIVVPEKNTDTFINETNAVKIGLIEKNKGLSEKVKLLL
ncbi:MAG TPA: phosphoribosylformylglycinamidine cyclo-ligase [Candidatus Cloacimonadota bacterium]|nr:phosphoribosylformylglycinamidine cyclo-ligase [Candidatus Cloacimonadota bacterium]HPT70663.1 phosphoribosylformylglycinamidine cyclo-ligase [Candidatus Cloacimonadota bacterium]